MGVAYGPWGPAPLRELGPGAVGKPSKGTLLGFLQIMVVEAWKWGRNGKDGSIFGMAG